MFQASMSAIINFFDYMWANTSFINELSLKKMSNGSVILPHYKNPFYMT